ncbi:MAG: hypothetical protein AAB215_03570 [Planctomycetota bacterium]
MKELIIAFAFIGLAMAGIAIGRIVRGKCLRRACAGKFGEDGQRRKCPTCECEKASGGEPPPTSR